MPRLLIASPHRYPDLARLWHRSVLRDVAPAFRSLGLTVEIEIFRDANADQFIPRLFPGVRLTSSMPGMRDFMEYYDAALHAPCDFLLFIDADTFLLDAARACAYFEAFTDLRVAGVSLIPRKNAPAIFALLCRTESYRALPAPALACRYEFPENWPNGKNLQPGDFAARELARRGKIVIHVDASESSRHTVNFRGTTGLRASREHITGAAGEAVFLQFVAEHPAYLVAAYDNLLLGCLYESLFGELFAPDSAGRRLGASLTIAELQDALKPVRDAPQMESLTAKFQQSYANITRMAAREGRRLTVPAIDGIRLTDLAP